MGHRANYVLRRGGCTQLFYSHWGALSLAQDIFWGPDETTRFIRSLRPADELLDDASCEGAAVVDWDARRLIWFEGDRLVQGPIQRRLYARLLEQTWSDWEIDYAADGILGIATYLEIAAAAEQAPDAEANATCGGSQSRLGLRPDPVGTESQPPTIPAACADEDQEESDAELADDLEVGLRPAPRPAGGKDATAAAEPGVWLAVRRADGCVEDYFGFDHPALDQVLLRGPPLLDLLPVECATTVPPESAVWGGAVIDAASQRLGYWELQAELDFARRVEQAWPGWRVERLAGGWDELLQWSGREAANELRADEHACLGALVALLLDEDRLDPQAMRDSLHEATRGVTAGCGCVAVLVTLAAAAVAAWVRTASVTIACVVVALAVLVPVIRIRRRTARLVAMAEDFDDAPPCAGPSLLKKRSLLDQALARLGHPTTDQLEQSGQLSVSSDGPQADSPLPDRFGPLRPLRADEIAGVEFYQLRLGKLRFHELRRGTTLWQACLIKCLAPFGYTSGPTIPVPRAQRLIQLAWDDFPPHVRQRLDPWIKQAVDSGFAPGLYYTLPMLGRQEAFGVTLLDAEGCVLALFLYARIRLRVADEEGDTYSDEQLAEASLLSVLPHDAVLVTETRRSEFDPLPSHDVETLEDADWPALLAAHQQRLDAHDRTALRRFTAADLPAFVLHLNQQEIDTRAAQGVYQPMTREDIDRFAEEG